MLCAIWHHLNNLKNMKTPMEECYFIGDFHGGILLKLTLFHGCFSRFLNCKNDNKSGKASQM